MPLSVWQAYYFLKPSAGLLRPQPVSEALLEASDSHFLLVVLKLFEMMPKNSLLGKLNISSRKHSVKSVDVVSQHLGINCNEQRSHTWKNSHLEGNWCSLGLENTSHSLTPPHHHLCDPLSPLCFGTTSFRHFSFNPLPFWRAAPLT